MRDILLSRDNLLSPTKRLGPFSRDVKSDYYLPVSERSRLG